MRKWGFFAILLGLLSIAAAAQSQSGATDSDATQSLGSHDAFTLKSAQSPDSTVVDERLTTTDTRRTQAKEPQKPAPQEPPTEFQMLAADSAGHMPAIFGSEIFRHPAGDFSPLDSAPAPANYIIEPGDQLLVNLWGSVSLRAQLTVNREGRIFVPKVGEIAVAGVALDHVEDRLRSEINRIYRNYELSASLGRLRSMQIYVTGQAKQPGSYTVNALSTLLTALFAAGGPNAHGSMRHVELRRAGRLVVDFDLYDFLLKGDVSKSVTLQPEDVIYIPSVGPQAALLGSLNAPAIYELRDGEVNLGEALAMAGGLSNVADGGRLTIERIDDRRTRSIAELSLDVSGRAQKIKDGDIIRVFSIVPRFDNAITLRGNVANPGRYAWRAGMRVRDLIPSKEALLTRDYWRQQNCMVDGRANEYAAGRKQKPQPATAQQNDAQPSGAQIRDAQQKLLAKPEEQIGDCVYMERQKFVDDKNLTADSLLDDSRTKAPEINWEYASIQRRNEYDLTTEIVPFSLRKAVLDNDAASNLELKPGDVVTIFSQKDLAVSQGRESKIVRVEGEVRFPGIYRVNDGETLRALLQKAGGLTEKAYPYAAFFTRESARVEQQKAIAQIADELETEIHQRALANMKKDTTANNAASMEQSQMSLVRSLRQTVATGRVVLALHPDDSGVEQFPEMTLENGDHLVVPARSNTVSVVGSVFNQSSYLYRKGLTVNTYLRQAGGGTASADHKRIMLVRADGSVLGGNTGVSLWGGDVKSVRVLPGDTIVLPAKLDAGSFSQSMREWMTIAAQGAIAAAVVMK